MCMMSLSGHTPDYKLGESPKGTHMMAVSWLKEQQVYLILLKVPGIHDVCEAAVLVEGEQVCRPIAKLDAAACA